MKRPCSSQITFGPERRPCLNAGTVFVARTQCWYCWRHAPAAKRKDEQ